MAHSKLIHRQNLFYIIFHSLFMFILALKTKCWTVKHSCLSSIQRTAPPKHQVYFSFGFEYAICNK